MDFGVVTDKVDEIGYITHAENLGYTHCWVTDSQMIRSNCWAVLALAAQQTRTMRPGHRGECARLTAGPSDGQWHCHDQPSGAWALFHQFGDRPHGHAHVGPETNAVKT